MKQRFSRMISFFMCLTLMASVIAGALSVSVHFAKAAVPSAGYFDDLVNEALPYVPNQYASDFVSKINDIKSNLDVSTSVVFVLCNYEHTKFYFGYYKVTSGTNMSNFYWYSDNNNLRFKKHGNNTNYAFFLGAAVCVFDSYQSFTYSGSSLANSSFNTGTFGVDTNNLYFPSASYAAGSIDCYSNAELQDSNGVYMSVNLFSGSQPAPPELQFSVRTFWLGERQYFTVVDQYLMYSMIDYNNEGEILHSFRALFYADADEEVSIYLPYEDTVLIANGNDFIDGLSNVSPEGVYAWDITNKGLLSVIEMFYYDHVDGSTGDIYRGYAINCPYDLTNEEPGSNGQPDSYTNFWSEFNEYVSNYNTTVIVPDQLSDSLFGINGMELYPVSVAAPHQSLTTWKWWSNLDDLAINYELMDTVIIHSGNAEYTLVYYYGTEYPAAFIPVQNINLNELFDKFDCVIIVPDDQGELDKTSWWESILDYLEDELGLDFDFTVTSNFAVSGSASGGVEYVSGRPSNALVTLDGYCFVTPKGIQRQHLYAFSDGISKLYKLLSDYVESEDNWKTSFLTFSSSLFYGINTLNGTLGNILTEIGSLRNDINRKLDTLINNTSPDIPEGDVWYTALWQWIMQFKPTNENFSNSLQVYDDNWNQIPQISAAPSIPLIPTLGG